MSTQHSEASEPSLRWYGIYDTAGLDDDDDVDIVLDVTCQTVLTLLRPRLRRAKVDAIQEYEEMRGTPASVAFHRLQDRAAQLRGRGHRNRLIPLDLTRDEDWALLFDYAARSTHVELYGDPADTDMGTFDDGGEAIVLRLRADEVTQLQGQLDPRLHLRALPRSARRRLWRWVRSR